LPRPSPGLDGYALDASLSTSDDTTTPDQAASFLESVQSTSFESRPGVSLGDDVQAESDDLVATGIGWGGELLHLVCFASGFSPVECEGGARRP
jgi:hypothetical protein